MPQGYTTCKYCGKQVSSRCFQDHLEVCDKCNPAGFFEESTEPKKAGRPRTSEESKYKNPILGDNTPKGWTRRKGVMKNPYSIAMRFIKNQIADGSIDLNLAQLVSDGRATIKLNNQTQELTIKIDLAKFRNNLNKEYD